MVDPPRTPQSKQRGRVSPRITLEEVDPSGVRTSFLFLPAMPGPTPPSRLPGQGRDLTGSRSHWREGAARAGVARSGGRPRRALPALEVESGGAVIAAQQIPSFLAAIAAIVVSGPAASPGLLLGPPALFFPIFAPGGSQEGLDLLHTHRTDREGL